MTIELYKRDLEIEWDGRFFAQEWEMVAKYTVSTIVIFGVSLSWVRYWDRLENLKVIRHKTEK